MHDIEPHYKWRDQYRADEDEKSPFFGTVYNEFCFTNKVYNYFIHPQWDDFGSTTLYLKIIYVDYAMGFCAIEFIGEWDDCIRNDVMTLKRNVIDVLLQNGVNKFFLIGENILNFHYGEDDYYEEWSEDVRDLGGFIMMVNLESHVLEEMMEGRLHNYIYLGEAFQKINWRKYKAESLLAAVESMRLNRDKFLQ